MNPKLEHIAFQVQDPEAFADWYVQNLSLKILQKGPPPSLTHFLTDENQKFMIEIYRNPSIDVPDYHKIDHRVLHLAFFTHEIEKLRDRLVQAGAKAVHINTNQGTTLAMLRDPWGLAIQLAQRDSPLIH